MEKCKSCGAKIVKFPLKDENGKFLWKNLFKMDLYSILLFIIVIGMVIGYKADIAECDEVIEDPCGFCMKSNCCDYLAKGDKYNVIGKDLGLVDINITN